MQRFGRAGQDAIFALKFLQPVGAADPGEVAVARNPEADSAPVHHGVHRPSPYAQVQRHLTAFAAVDGLIRVVGPPGSGKRYQASTWLRRRTGQEPEIVAVRDLCSDDTTWTRLKAALCDGRGVLVVGGEHLSGEMRDRLEDFARLPPPGVRPEARVVLTERTGGSERGSDAGPVAVRVPALAALREELLDVVRDVAADVLPGAPLLRFSPAALQCMLAWPWPGNIAELIRVLAALPDEARRRLIQAKDLPASMQETTRSTLSRYEQGERAAIVSALREAGGNKARAADILGIGRTTLYRKMRSLKIGHAERMTAPGR